MSKMKLCPCCQGEGAVRYKKIFAGVIPRPQWPVIQCDECGLATKPYPTEAAAIAAWNTRAGEAITSGYYQVEPIGEQPPTKTTVAVTCQGCQEKEAELVALRQEKNEAIGAALAVEQKCYDQAQELAALRKLREAAQYVCDCWQIDSDNEHAVVPFGPASMLQDMLAAWDGGSVCIGQDIGGRVVSESQTKLRRKLRAALDADGARMWKEGYKAGWLAGLAKGHQDGWDGCEQAIRSGAVTIVNNNTTIEAKASGENR